jgi:hypothetical protein
MDFLTNRHLCRMRIINLFTVVLLLNSVSSLAQSNRKTELLYKFMQANSDTTIVFERVFNWVPISPEIYLISKKGDTLTCYTYRDLVYQRNEGILIPTNIRREMRKISNRKILTDPINVNEFLNVCAINLKNLNKLWNGIKNEKPWSLLDDEIEGKGCFIDSKSIPKIHDGGGFNLYLITKSKIKLLYFYAHAYYEKYCKGRQGRKSIAKIGSLFAKYVQ